MFRHCRREISASYSPIRATSLVLLTEVDQQRQPGNRPGLVGVLAIVGQFLTCKARLAYHMGK
jgi:hypothetical protein